MGLNILRLLFRGERGKEPALEVKSNPQEVEVNISDYYPRLNRQQLDDLCDGRWITIVMRDGDVSGKLKAQTFRDVDGYSFVYQNKYNILEIPFIRPAEQDRELGNLKLHFIEDDRYFLESKRGGWLTSCHNAKSPFEMDYGELRGYLQQEQFVLN